MLLRAAPVNCDFLVGELTMNSLELVSHDHRRVEHSNVVQLVHQKMVTSTSLHPF